MQSESLPRLMAPREHGAILAYPPLDDVGALLTANARRLAGSDPAIAGRPLADLRTLARLQTLDAARFYLAEAGESLPDWVGARLFVAGHQPEMFHPGVWFKNFALQTLARRHGAVPLNFVVDNDTAKATTLRVPHGAHVVKVPFDSWHSDAPFEERTVQDEELFASLAKRVEPLVADWPFRPLLGEFWSEALRAASRTRLLGERLASARRHVERAWGWRPLEVPLSRVCQTEAFAWFAVHLLENLPRFHADYNAALRAYRLRHGLNSTLHPVPDLARDDDWLEAPFWAWRRGEQRRQRLWVRARRGYLDLRAGTTLGSSLLGVSSIRIEQFRNLSRAGFNVRTRALTTTLFARVLLGDLFIHGIGGGKYDEVTDGIIRQFFGLEPPGYLVLTATMLLPLERRPQAETEHRDLLRRLRDVRWHPERHIYITTALAAQPLRDEKQRWIEQACTTAEERKERFAHLRQINERLYRLARPEEERIRKDLADTARRMALHHVHSSREYAFCLFPEEMLRDFYQRSL